MKEYCGQLEGPFIALGKTGPGHLILNLNFPICKMGLLQGINNVWAGTQSLTLGTILVP